MRVANLLVLTPNADQYREHLKLREGLNPVFYGEPPRELQRLRQVSIVLGSPKLVAAIIDELPSVKWVQSTFAGVDRLCIPEKRRDYLLTGVKGVFGPLMAEHILAYLLAVERNLFQVHDNQRQRLWKRIPYRELRGQRLGICGLGDIGAEVAKRAAAFGLRVTGLRRTGGAPSEGAEKLFSIGEIQEFLSDLDYLVNLLPNTPSTKYFFNRERLSFMKRGAIFFNVGRGSAIREADIIWALEEGIFRKAVLDVFESEPLPKESPLWTRPDVLITPHHSAYSFPEQIMKIFDENLERFRKGESLKYLVDFERGY